MISNKILLICLAFIALTACSAGSKKQTNHHMENEKRTLVKLETTMGNVATYRQVAKMAGNEKMSRAVGNALHKNPDPEHIPCFRVVNAKGELAGAFAFGGANVQAELLREDGVEVIDGKVDLKKYQM